MRRQQIITQAADLLRGGGRRALTSVAVAERLGITQSAIYRHIRDMDELTALAAQVVVTDLHSRMRSLLLEPTMDWTDVDDVSQLCRTLVQQVADNHHLVDVVAQWRFDDGALGESIREVIDADCDLIATLLESRWRRESAYHPELDDQLRSVVRAHASAIHDDVHSVVRLVHSPTMDALAIDDVAAVLRYRVAAGWVAFVRDINTRLDLKRP